MMVTDGDPSPKRFMADTDTSMPPSLSVANSEHGSGLIEGTVQTLSLQAASAAEIMRERQRPPVLELV